MKYRVSQMCVGCGTCSGVCPTGALWTGGERFVIDPDLCVGCATCYRLCPMEAIVPAEGDPLPHVLPADVTYPEQFPLVKHGMPLNLDGTPISMEQWLGQQARFDHIDRELQADVIVVGGGLSGTCAARAAAEQGAKVVLFEKMNGPRGRSGDMAVIGSKLTKDWWGWDLTQRKEEIFRQFMRDLGWRSNYHTIRYWLDHNGEAFDWFMQASPDVYISPTSSAPVPADCRNWIAPKRWPLPEGWDMDAEQAKTYPVTLRFSPSLVPELWASFRKGMATGNITPFWNTPVRTLLRSDSGEMTGVIAQNTHTGQVIRCKAKAVILATGDFVGDKAMVYYYAPWAIRDFIGPGMCNPATPYRTNVGDGHKMAMRIGAVMEDGPIGLMNHCMGGPLGCAGFLNINTDGVRFMNEELDGQSWEHILSRQRECRGYQIFDSAFESQLPHMNPGHGAVCAVSPDPSTISNPVQNFQPHDSYTSLADVVRSVEHPNPMQPPVYMADTVEDLLAQLDLDEDSRARAAATIEHYNRMCELGQDEEFGKRGSRMFPVNKPPFFAGAISTAGVLCTVGGLDCDGTCRVLDEQRRPIPGLYACGNIQGGRFPVDYPMILPGISHSSCVTFGRLAGSVAAEFAKD